jgi:hypothetical protein
MAEPILPEDAGMLRRAEMYAEPAYPEDVELVEFEFDEGRFRVTVIPDDDTIETAWRLATEVTNPLDPRLVRVPHEFWASLLGWNVLHWRIMTNQRGYTDAIELEMTPPAGEYRRRFVRIEAGASRLRIQEMVAARTTDAAP